MMTKLACPYLKTEVELTDEREAHIRAKHPELLPQHRDHLIHTLADPSPTDCYWIVTAYVARQLSGGTVTWTRP